MTFLLQTTLKISIVLAAALITALMLRKRSAAVRHRILAVGLLVAASTPVIAVIAPAWYIAEPELAPVSIDLPAEASAAPPLIANIQVESAAPSIFSNLRFLWLSGIVVTLTSLIVGTARLALVTMASRPLHSDMWNTLSASIGAEYQCRRNIRLLQSRNRSMLVTWGVLSPTILLPAGASEWTKERADVVLSHELAHVRRHDWIVQVASEMFRAVFWFNPLVWIVCARLRIESEYACDDAALVRGIDSAVYASHLLDLARILNIPNRAWSAALGMARPSTLERRFQAMLNSTLNRRPVTNAAMILIVAVMVAVAVPIATYSSTAPQLSTSELSGKVSDSSGAAVRSATVVISTPEGKTEVTGTTNANGRFAFTNLPAGMHVVQVFATGFGPSRITNVELKAGGQTVHDVTMDIGFVAVQEARPVALRPVPVATAAQGSLSATVTDPTGALVPGVMAMLQFSSGARRTTLTNENGAFKFDAVPNGVYGLVIMLPGFKTLNISNVNVSGPTVYPNTIKLAVGVLAEEVTIRASANPADTGTSEPPQCAALQPAPPPQPDSTLPGRIRQGGEIQLAMLLGQVRPIYPVEAKASGIDGAVIMEIVVGRDGRVLDVKVISGHPLLTPSALDAVRRWCYKPTLLNGQPVEVVSTVTVNFAQ